MPNVENPTQMEKRETKTLGRGGSERSNAPTTRKEPAKDSGILGPRGGSSYLGGKGRGRSYAGTGAWWSKDPEFLGKDFLGEPIGKSSIRRRKI